MGHDALSSIGSADEAQTPPASVPRSCSGSDPSDPLFPRRLAQHSALVEFGESALSATALEPFLAEATELLHRAFPAPGAGVPVPPGGDEDEVAFVASVADIREAAIGKLLWALEVSRHAALHDPLTGLANRSLILDHLQLALARASRRSTLAAVVFLDLDGFKQTNDTLGHVAGDELLMLVAERLRSAVRPADTLGRWGGDEFVVVCEDLERASDAPALAGRIAAAFELPFDVADTELYVAASIGVAVSAGTDQPATLIHAADSAMYQAKRNHQARSRNGHEPAAFPHRSRLPKQERLTRRLLEVLSTLEVDDPPAAAPEGPADATRR